MPVLGGKAAEAEATMMNSKQQPADKGGRNPLRQHHHHHHGPGGIGSAASTVTERLYGHGHICSHARCAANNPNYNVKASTPTKKFLVAKKNKPGAVGWGDPSKATTTAPVKGTSSNHDQSHALHSLTNSTLQNPTGKARDRSSLPYSKGRNVQQDRSLFALAQSVLQHSQAKDADENVSRRPSGTLVRKLSTPTASSLAKTQQPQQRRASSGSGRTSVGSVVTEFPSRGPTQSKPWANNPTHPAMRLPSADKMRQSEESASPKSSMTSVSITQVVSTSRGDMGDQEQTQRGTVGVRGSSPTASVCSVGSNPAAEIMSSLKESGNVSAHETDPGLSGMYSESVAPTSDILTSSLSDDKLQQSPRGPALPSAQQQQVTDSPSSSVNSNPLMASPGLACSNPEDSSASDPGRGEDEVLSSSPPRTAPEKATTAPGSVSQSSTPGQMASESPTSMVVSDSGRPSPSSVSSSGPGRYSPKDTAHGPSGEAAAAASAKKPSRISKPSVSQCRMDPPSLSNASQLARKFVTDPQGTTGAREPGSTKGVRSIELRGGKAQSYSRTTTVTSLNLTTTTIDSAPPMSESTSSEANSNSGLSRSISAAAAIRPSWQGAGMENPAAGISDPSKENADTAVVHHGMKYARRGRSTTVVEELLSESESISLNHGEVAERRLSDEWLTNHALEGVVKQIADKDHRVKVLVHAFETLTNLTDPESQDNDEGDRHEAQLEYEAMPPAPIAA